MPVIVVMGVSGSGKSSLALELARRLSVRFVEGDALHPVANVEKMTSGIPLTDADRLPWLEQIGGALAVSRHEGGAVAACSSLKRAYRDVLRECVGSDLRFVHLAGSRALLLSRMKERKGHFMPVSLLDSQFADLEPPSADENTLTVDCVLPVSEAAERVLGLLG